MNAMPADQTPQIPQGYFGLTDSIPQEGWYWAAMASVAVSAALWLVGKRDWSTFVGQWPPTFLLLGLLARLQVGSLPGGLTFTGMSPSNPGRHGAA